MIKRIVLQANGKRISLDDKPEMCPFTATQGFSPWSLPGEQSFNIYKYVIKVKHLRQISSLIIDLLIMILHATETNSELPPGVWHHGTVIPAVSSVFLHQIALKFPLKMPSIITPPNINNVFDFYNDF